MPSACFQLLFNLAFFFKETRIPFSTPAYPFKLYKQNPLSASLRTARRLLVCAGVWCIVSTANVYGQNAANLTLTELQGVASSFVSRGDFSGGLPFLTELKTRFAEDPEQAKLVESVTFFIGRGYMQQYSKGDKEALGLAAATFQEYVEKYPQGTDFPYALANLADCLRATGKFVEAAPYMQQLVGLSGINEKLREDTREKIVQAYYITKSWGPGLEWFLRIKDESRNPETRAAAATAAMQAYIETNQLNDALKLLPDVTGDNPSRYNIAFNISLLEAGDKLVKEERFIQASLLFTMTLSVGQISNYFENRIASLERRISALEYSVSEDAEALRTELRTDVQNLRNQLEVARSVTDYTPELRTRIARTFVQSGRDWEGFWAYMQLINEFPNHALIELFTYSAFAQAKKTDMENYVREIGERYMRNPAFTEYKNEVAVQLAQYYAQRNELERVMEISQAFIAENPTHPYTAQFAYFMGDAFLKMAKPEEMLTTFDDLLRRYPNSPMADGLLFWGGLASIFTDKMEKAFKNFDTIVSRYPASSYYTDAIYRSGIAAFGLENYDEARKRFLRLIEEAPKSGVRGEAEFFLGQIYGMGGDFDSLQKAFQHYDNVEKYTDVHRYVKDAYFKKAELQEANEMYADMAQTFRTYINKFSEVGSVTDATFRLGEAYEYLGQPNEMLKEYLGAIERFGNDPQREGIDKIIDAYPIKYYEKLNMINANLGLLTKLVDDRVFLERIVGWVSEPPIDPTTGRPTQDPKRFIPYRNKRFALSYFMGNADVKESFDPTLVDNTIKSRLQREDDFAKGLLMDTSPLLGILREWQEMKDSFPKDTPEQTYLPLYERAKSYNEKTLMFRLMRALQAMGNTAAAQSYFFTAEDFRFGSPSLIVWMGKQALDAGDTVVAQQAWELVANEYSTSEAALDAYLYLGDLHAETFQEYAKAYQYYNRAQNQFPVSDRAKEAALKQGDMLRKQRQWKEAIAVYEAVTKTPAWRGPAHAEALFKIGLTFVEAGDLNNAHPILQRTYLAHAFHAEWAAKAYVLDAQVLQKLGKTDEARLTLQEFLDKENLRETESYYEGRNLLNSL